MTTTTNHHSEPGARSCGHTFSSCRSGFLTQQGTITQTAGQAGVHLSTAAVVCPTARFHNASSHKLLRPQDPPSTPPSHQPQRSAAEQQTQGYSNPNTAPSTQARAAATGMYAACCPLTVTVQPPADQPLRRLGAQGKWGRLGTRHPQRTPPQQQPLQRRLVHRPQGPQARCRRGQ